ncbi:MAG: M48 family metalloprotease [Flavobacteriales bacterium]|nr:M48 family metalloprotease [Flavobacteriales bacterium]
MRKKFFVLVILLMSISAVAQERINLDFDQSCSYYGEIISDDVYGFNSTNEAQEIVRRIVDVVGLEQNFDIMSANVPNALATIGDNRRMIFYSQNFILNIESATGTDWAGISILAHEIGHHLNGHTIIVGGSRPSLELEADKFAGFVSAKLGASLKESQAAINQVASSTGSSTHPPKSARLEATAIGWNHGKQGLTPTKENSGSVPKPRIDIELLKTSTDIRIVYLGDEYGCRLPITITIGNRTFTPISSSYQIMDIPKGSQKYKIEGKINCPKSQCWIVESTGTIDVKANSTFYVHWKSEPWMKCKAWLSE